MNCDGIARSYWLLEYLVFGRALERRRREFLEQLAGARRVLILGDGDGRFTAEFAARYPLAAIHSLDLSAGMLALARRRLCASELRVADVQLRQGDARTSELIGTYDLVVTHFFLDCFAAAELRDLSARISEHCCPGAQWVISEFCVPPKGFRRFGARLLIRLMYWFFQLTTGLTVKSLTDHSPILFECGFQRIGRRATAGGLLVSELWQQRLW